MTAHPQSLHVHVERTPRPHSAGEDYAASSADADSTTRPPFRIEPTINLGRYDDAHSPELHEIRQRAKGLQDRLLRLRKREANLERMKGDSGLPISTKDGSEKGVLNQVVKHLAKANEQSGDNVDEQRLQSQRKLLAKLEVIIEMIQEELSSTSLKQLAFPGT